MLCFVFFLWQRRSMGEFVLVDGFRTEPSLSQPLLYGNKPLSHSASCSLNSAINNVNPVRHLTEAHHTSANSFTMFHQKQWYRQGLQNRRNKNPLIFSIRFVPTMMWVERLLPTIGVVSCRLVQMPKSSEQVATPSMVIRRIGSTITSGVEFGSSVRSKEHHVPWSFDLYMQDGIPP